MVEQILSNQKVKNLLDSNEKFDVCVVESFNIDAIVVSWYVVKLNF